MLRSLRWSYTFSPFREAERVKMIYQALWLMLGAALVLALVLAVLNAFPVTAARPFFAYLATVVYAGLCGGVVSWTQRLGSISTQADAFGSIYELMTSKYMQYLAPLSGAVFGVITMLLFMANVFSGSIFPEFKFIDLAVIKGSTWLFTSALRPEAPKDFGLLFLRCFIAGFAERLIPDTLRQFSQRLDAGVDAEKGSSLPRPAAPAHQ